jgi:hypothetical protein
VEALNEGWTEIDHPSPAGNQGGDDPILYSSDGNDYVLPKGWINAKDPIPILQEQEHQDENYTEVEWVDVTDPALGNKYFVASQQILPLQAPQVASQKILPQQALPVASQGILP